MRVAAIVPAYNEEITIGDILKILLNSSEIDEVIVVDDGSDDETAEISKKLGAKVVGLKENRGKGSAMGEGLRHTTAEIVLFLDADLIGFKKEYIPQIIRPVLKREAVMCVGIRKRLWGLPRFFVRVDPLLAISGIRALRRFVFERIPPKFIKGFGVETALNYYCKVKKLPVRYIELKNIKQLAKEEKWGWVTGFFQRVKLIFQIIIIRIRLLYHRKNFRKL